MLNSVGHLVGARIAALDGEIGHVREVYFDDQRWAVRYLVVDAGTWLSGREVLVSPYSVVQPIDGGKRVEVSLTRQQIHDSPPIDTHKPVSRQHEREYLSYYALPWYWEGGELWAMSGLPMVPVPSGNAVESALQRESADRAAVPAEDTHLRSSAAVNGYDIQASDGSIGHVCDFIFDDESWALRYFVVDTRNWWPGGRKVLLSHRWIDRIDWAEKTVYTPLNRAQVRASPEYHEESPIQRDYEKRLHSAYDRAGYWD